MTSPIFDYTCQIGRIAVPDGPEQKAILEHLDAFVAKVRAVDAAAGEAKAEAVERPKWLGSFEAHGSQNPDETTRYILWQERRVREMEKLLAAAKEDANSADEARRMSADRNRALEREMAELKEKVNRYGDAGTTVKFDCAHDEHKRVDLDSGGSYCSRCFATWTSRGQPYDTVRAGAHATATALRAELATLRSQPAPVDALDRHIAYARAVGGEYAVSATAAWEIVRDRFRSIESELRGMKEKR